MARPDPITIEHRFDSGVVTGSITGTLGGPDTHLAVDLDIAFQAPPEPDFPDIFVDAGPVQIDIDFTAPPEPDLTVAAPPDSELWI